MSSTHLSQLFEILSELGINSGADVMSEIPRLERDEAIELAKLCSELASRSTHKDVKTGSFFNFAASSSVSGGIHPCADHTCRLRNVQELAVFSALYADTVFIPNYFEYSSDEDLQFPTETHFNNFLMQFCGDLILLFDLKPLLVRGIIKFSPRRRHYCENHYHEAISDEKKFSAVLDRVGKNMSVDLFKKTTFILDSPNTIKVLSDKNFCATESIFFISLPEKFYRFKKKIPYTFSRTEAKTLGLDKYLIHPIFDDLILQRTSVFKDLAYITNRSLEASILDGMTPRQSDPNIISARVSAINHALPFVQNADVGSLLTLRDREQTAFAVYRDAITDLLKNTRNEDDEELIRREIESKIQPEINKIKNLIHIRRSAIKKKRIGDLAFNAIALSIGFAAEKILNVPAGTSSVVVGSLATAKEITNHGSLREVPAEVMENPYYFLWKMENSL